MPEQVAPFIDESSQSQMPGCSGPAVATADNCSVTIDVTCENTTLGILAEDKGTVHWSDDGAMGAGIVQGIITDAKTKLEQCSETYDVTWTRL